MLEPFATASPPAAVISSTTLCAARPPLAGDPSRPTPMSLTTTRAPSAAKAIACARPIPPPAPVTMTTRPSTTPIPMLLTRLLVGARGAQVGRRLTAAVPLQCGSADIRGQIGSQKRCGPADVAGLSQPSQWHCGGDTRNRLGVTVEQLGLFGLDHAYHHRVDPNLRSPFHRQCESEVFQARLGHTVGGRTRSGTTTADAADIHNRSTVGLLLH